MTKNFKTVRQSTKILESFTCDVCKTTYIEDECDLDDWQERLSIDFVVGYGGILGDGNRIECDLCQRCVKTLLGPYLRVIETDVMW